MSTPEYDPIYDQTIPTPPQVTETIHDETEGFTRVMRLELLLGRWLRPHIDNLCTCGTCLVCRTVKVLKENP